MVEIYAVEEISESTDSVKEFMLKHPNAQIHEIDGKGVVGMCEVCGYPILEDDDFISYADGIVTHKEDCSGEDK